MPSKVMVPVMVAALALSTGTAFGCERLAAATCGELLLLQPIESESPRRTTRKL
jgi:hypothetical protein